ncbi:nucleotidyltransferase family protein [Rhodoferax saidenbachensis]|uniref:Mannose-1-phosphate guanylyltransferase n=1 Tax=Rhodoferax saidenbachensis TaxID=1484693 RepID=A0A1P8K6H3_9BURK|nr:nucleotidyltransferase family protein [Rhodoferax saidenbachensis]APW41618.1 mannose-1-phosphate guanylyltransferase [Rhodoferax saidenbachensis]
MKAILLAAGLGTRLRPVTNTTPKCLVPIHGKPLLGYWLDLLLQSGTTDQVLINTHYLPDAVRQYVAASPWNAAVRLVHEDTLLGTGGTVLQNRGFLGDQAFMLVHADNLTRFDPAAFIAAHTNRPAGTELTMMTFDTDAPQTCGIVELDARGVVQAFHEKQPNPPGRRANAAVYIFEPSVVDYIVSLNREVCDISTEVLPHFLGRMNTFHNADYHRDIGNLESLALAEREY